MHKALAVTALLLSTLALSAQTVAANHTAAPHPAAHPIITFDPPGSAGTEPVAINDAGVITGYYFIGTSNRGSSAVPAAHSFLSMWWTPLKRYPQ
jgi:hypothetical protein